MASVTFTNFSGDDKKVYINPALVTNTYGEGTFTAFSAAQRQADVTFQAQMTFPVSPTDGAFFEMGGSTYGCWNGIRDTSGTQKLRVRAGAGGSLSASSTTCAMLNITDFPKDGRAHWVTWDYRVNPGRVRLWIGNVLMGTGDTSGGGALSGSYWAGTNDGGYGQIGGSTLTGENSSAWSGDMITNLSFYNNYLIS